nr:hypothetical protein [Dyella japonica]
MLMTVGSSRRELGGSALGRFSELQAMSLAYFYAIEEAIVAKQSMHDQEAGYEGKQKMDARDKAAFQYALARFMTEHCLDLRQGCLLDQFVFESNTCHPGETDEMRADPCGVEKVGVVQDNVIFRNLVCPSNREWSHALHVPGAIGRVEVTTPQVVFEF